MTNKELNSKVNKLFNRFVKLQNSTVKSEKERDINLSKIEDLKKDCLTVHYIVGAYEVMTDKNALKMASICSTYRFVEPYRMLMELQKTTLTY
jgi:hypothetical protein